MNSSIIINVSILCLILTIAHSHPIGVSNHWSLYKRSVESTCGEDYCPGSERMKASLLEQFKEFYPHVTNRTIAIRNGLLVLSATEHEVKFTKGSYNYHLNCSNPELFFYKFEYTVNGSRMMSLVPVGSPELIVTWGPVDIGSGDIINVNSITYELKTENITDVFSMLSSNETDYEANWRFQMEFTTLTHIKILNEEGDLAVTNIYNDDYESGNATLQSKIAEVTNKNPDIQAIEICNDCLQDL